MPWQCLQQRAHEGHRTDPGEVAPWELLPGHADQGVVELGLDDGLILLPDTAKRKRGGLHGEAQADAVLLHPLRGDFGGHAGAVLRGLFIDGGHLTGGLRLLQRVFLLLGGVRKMHALRGPDLELLPRIEGLHQLPDVLLITRCDTV